MNNIFKTFKDVPEGLVWTLIVLSSILSFLGIALLTVYIYYSWIRRENSKNWNGEHVSRFILDQGELQDVQVVSSFFYYKYWNFNKRRRTFKLRPWTVQRRSIWTIMESAQQAYASTLRSKKSFQFWLLFRIPTIVVILAWIVAGGIFWFSFTKVENDSDMKWALISIGILIVAAGLTTAESLRIWILFKNVPPLLEKAQFTPEEVKAVRNIYLWRFAFAFVNAIMRLIQLIIQIVRETKSGSSII